MVYLWSFFHKTLHFLSRKCKNIEMNVLFLRPNFVKRQIMKKNLKQWALLFMMAITLPAGLMAQDKVEASVGADLVSKYIWRGQDLGGVSVQPSVSLAYKGLSLTAWGSVGFDGDDDKEIDLTLAYETGNFSISVTDYWYPEYSGSHTFEAQVGYDFGFLGVNWYTNFAGDDTENASYFSLTAPFSLIGLDWEAEAGATPWGTDYYGTDKFSVCDLSLGASKDIKITQSYSTSIFVKATFNPTSEKFYMTVGLSF